ncbi:MAG: glycosyltransferase [Bacteroidetes bacterium]|nr:glycosyltransferase [Bacteroidota bacterium]
MSQAKKVYILSYYFPPCNLTASERIYSWAKYLKNGDYYPIIITRNWDIPVANSTTSAFVSSGTEVRIEKHDTYEVHYLPYKSSIKDKLFIKLDGTKFYFIYLIASFIFSILSVVSIRFSPYYFFYIYLKELLQNQKGKLQLIVSASPFELFGIAFKLSKLFALQWIADYRDDWSTSSLHKENFVKQFLHKVFRYYEKRWLQSADCFLSVSDHYVDKISSFIHKKGYVLTNGYMPENYIKKHVLPTKFTLTYVGSLYPSQPIEKILHGIISFIESKNRNCLLEVVFVGIQHEAQSMNRISQSIQGYENYFRFTGRIPKQEAIAIQAASHLLLICAHENLKGIPGSKLYEYIALRKPVLVYPSDGDIIEESLSKTGQGIICHSQQDMLSALNTYYTMFDENRYTTEGMFDEKMIASFSREKQCEVLIQVLDSKK